MTDTAKRALAAATVLGFAAFGAGWLMGGGSAGGEGSGGRPAGDGRPAVLYGAPSFALQAQTGDTLSASDLRGSAWVLHVFFTHCRSICPATTGRMAALRDTLLTEGLLGDGVRLVSITVDPARDSLPVLRSWADRHGAADPERWAFLRGEPPERVRRLVQEGFRLSAMMPGDTTGDYQVRHSPRVLVVDPEGRVRDAVEILQEDEFRELVTGLRRLAG